MIIIMMIFRSFVDSWSDTFVHLLSSEAIKRLKTNSMIMLMTIKTYFMIIVSPQMKHGEQKILFLSTRQYRQWIDPSNWPIICFFFYFPKLSNKLQWIVGRIKTGNQYAYWQPLQCEEFTFHTSEKWQINHWDRHLISRMRRSKY